MRPIQLITLYADAEIVVHDHAVYQFGLRFPELTPTNQEELSRVREFIREEVQDAVSSGRVALTREEVGLVPPNDWNGLYAFTPEGERVYSVKFNPEKPVIAVLTTMRP